VPAEQWAHVWPAETTVLVRRASKALRTLVDDMQLPAFLLSNWHKLSDDRHKPGRAENTQSILRQLPVFTGSLLVKRLDLVDCDMNGPVAITLSGILAQCPDLAYLDLSHNDMGHQGMAHLSGGLRLCTSLKVLILTSNSIGDMGTLHLATVIPHLDQLAAIDLGHNNISGDAIDMFAPMLALTPKMRYIKLDNNLIGDNLKQLARAISCTDCRYLDISYNNVGLQGMMHIIPLMWQLKLATAGNPDLEDVIVVGTRDVTEFD
jgi:Ran GTPase-activating protein (RanGAP) involved in mRNA processing and transport